MPVPKDVMRSMVRHVESTMPVYPTRFHDLSAVKGYIMNTSAADALENGRLTYDVLDSVTYQVAMRAYQAGEFYLDAPRPDRKALRTAIDSAISLILPQIGSWPTGFSHFSEVKTFIGIVCAPIVDPLTFPTLSPKRFKDYVLFHTARQAWEDRKYDMKDVPDTWHRAALPSSRLAAQVPKSLSEAISLNIHLLFPLLSSHPLPPFFHDLNAARNHIGNICSDNDFEYVYWPGVEERKFRCFVHFNAAKRAWREGMFRGEGVRKEGFGVSIRAYGEDVRGRKGEAEKVEVIGEPGPVIVESEMTSSPAAVHGFDFLASKNDDDNDDLEIKEFGNEEPSTIKSCEESADGEGGRCDYAADMEDVKKIEEKVDPFKDLLYDLKRTAFLKAAFE